MILYCTKIEQHKKMKKQSRTMIGIKLQKLINLPPNIPLRRTKTRPLTLR